jgi:hypothetical protein
MIERMSEDGYLPDDVQQWVQDQADRHYGGNFGRAAAAILEAVYAASRKPQNVWALQEELLKSRGRLTS